MKIFRAVIIIIAFSTLYTHVFAQAGGVSIGGDVAKPFTITSANFTGFKTAAVKVKGKDGLEHEYTGILLSEVLIKAEAIPNNQLHGKAIAKFVPITATDGYQVVIALPEIDPSFTDQQVILANKMDGADLPAAMGPYRLIVPRDKRPARSVLHVTNIDVLTAKKP